MYEKSILTIVALFSFFINTSGQNINNSKSNRFVLSAEFGTWVLAGSATINFEGHLIDSEANNFHLYGRLGIVSGYIHPIFCEKDVFKGKLVGLTLLKGSGNHHFEINTGIYFISESTVAESNGFFVCTRRKSNLIPLLGVGYRYQKPEGGAIFCAKLGVLGVGVGVGYAF